ncbi:MAG: polysaccharide deacetylase [Dethiosulfovibrio peptidovorans]|nr:MAG: polysaccharide deacetylase [Dethiosulfovibrio peptidovorans]
MLYDFLNSSATVRLTKGLSKRFSFPLFYESCPWREPAFVLSFDVDFRRDVAALPQVCSMLSQFGVPASFACIGTWVGEYPNEHKMLVGEGHEIFNHSMRHPDNDELDRRRWNDLPLDEQRREIREAHEAIADVCEVEPKGFRMPHFGPQHRWHLYDMLKGLGYAYSSSTTCGGDYGFCRPLKVKGVELLEFPTATIPGMGYASFDSFNYFNKKRPFSEQGRCMPRDFEVLLEKVVREKLLGTLYFDPYDFVARPEYREILKALRSFQGDVTLCRYKDALNMSAGTELV